MFKKIFMFYDFNINYLFICSKILEKYNKYPSFYDIEYKKNIIKNIKNNIEINNYYYDIIYYYNEIDSLKEEWNNYFLDFINSTISSYKSSGISKFFCSFVSNT